MFISRYQRPLDVVRNLKGKPLWSASEMAENIQLFIRQLERNWKALAAEVEIVRNSSIRWRHDELLQVQGDWKFLQILTGRRESTNVSVMILLCL